MRTRVCEEGMSGACESIHVRVKAGITGTEFNVRPRDSPTLTVNNFIYIYELLCLTRVFCFISYVQTANLSTRYKNRTR